MPLDDAINLVAQIFESGLDNKQTGTGNNSRGGKYVVFMYIYYAFAFFVCLFTIFAICLLKVFQKMFEQFLVF